MKSKIPLLIGVVSLAALQLSPAQVVGQWNMNEGSGSTLYDTSGNNWNMTINGDPNLWGYQQPGAYQFANGGYAASAVTATSGWTSGETLTLSAEFNVTGNVHNPGQVFGGGGIFGADYFISTGGNSLGYNSGAFYAQILTSGTPTIQFDISGISPGVWSASLPASVTDPSVNGGWNTAQWVIQNNVAQNSMTLQFVLNGSDIGSAISISGGYLADFAGRSNYTGTEYEIGACAAGYQQFAGALQDVSLVATPVPEPSTFALVGLTGLIALEIRRRLR
jgi:hypothetical protein